MLIVNFNRVLMDESWIDPENFRPERFLDSSGNVVTPEKYFPFSIGIYVSLSSLHYCLYNTLV